MRKINGLIHIGIFVVAVALFACIFISKIQFTGEDRSKLKDFSEGWIYQDGTIAEVDNLKEENKIIVLHEITEDVSGYNLCFRSKNINFSVYMGKTKIYDFHPAINKVCGHSYGNYIHSILILSGNEGETIRIEAEPVYADGTEFFDDMYMDTGDNYYLKMIKKNLVRFIICILIMVLGVGLFTLGSVFERKNEGRAQTQSLGLMAFLTGMWVMMESLILQMLTHNSPVCHLINYMTLILLPIPAIYLVSYMTGHSKSNIKEVICAIVLLNFVFQVYSTVFGTKDYHDLLGLTHGIIALTVVVAAWLLIRALIGKKEKNKSKFMIVFAFLILGGGGIIDIVRYHEGKSYGTAFMIGIFLFVLYLGYYEIKEVMKMQERNRHAKELSRLAHQDVLTQVESRLSFNEYEEKIKNEKTGNYLIVQFDVNNLKKVNDRYGHHEGDHQITAAANLIKESFQAKGHIFRTGGDEFIAILKGKDIEVWFRQQKEVFDKKIKEYNETEKPSVILSIACGAANYVCGKDELEQVEIRADSLMYENKKKLKEIVDK